MIRPFDVCGELPSGVTVLEASAGTGKTYTIAALATRYVAEGTPLKQLLLVTFTRMATGELRERVRERLVEAERVLAGAAPATDPLLRLLLDGTPVQVAERRARLAGALADFDAATIATTHGFCQEVLGGLGLDADADAEFVEDVSDLVDEVVDDLYVRRFHGPGSPDFTRDEARRIALAAVANPAAPLEPEQGDGRPAMRRRLAQAVRDELERRKQRTGVMTYDDLLTRLDAILAGPTGEALARRLRERWKVVLVDEFQDTDPIQWDIMRRAFGTGTLVLIGDPKQAIYAFRGADVFAYLDAARAAGAQATLETNWRSDQSLIEAYDALFGGAKLGHPGIVYRRVRAGDPDRRSPYPGAALRMRVVHRDDVQTTATGYAAAPAARGHIARDLAADLVDRLSDGSGLAPGDVAVLVRTNRNAAQVRDALDAAGIPAVINGAGSVFGTDPARDWLRLLEAIERPTSAQRAHAAALTPFLGWSAAEVATASEAAWEEVHQRLHGWARLLREQGVASLSEAITLDEGLPARVLATTDGERDLTDLRHVAQLLHAAATAEQLGITALTGWLRRRIAEADQDAGDEDRSRRLESDAAAVQVLTIHRSKGLEFPVVYCPDLWDPTWISDEHVPVTFHDPARGDRRVVDVGLEGPDYAQHRTQHLIEQRGEDLRLAYVALTRARHQAVIWWVGSRSSRDSALGRLLFARADDGTVAWKGRSGVSDATAIERFDSLAAEAPGCIAVERSQLGLPASWPAPLAEPGDLSAATFDRTLDRGWRRTSFTDITAAAHEARVASEPEEPELADDEPQTELPPAATDDAATLEDDALRAVPSRLEALPRGVRVGTFVHRVFEATDFAAEDLDTELGKQVEAVLARRPLDIGDSAAAVAGLRAAIETPLGPLLGGARLRDLSPEDRLDELEFELPLAGGDTPSGRLALEAIAAALDAHLAPGDPLAGYATRLADPALRDRIRGYVTGSLDLVARVDGRFAVVDYKTNWLGVPGEPLTAWDHRPAALRAEMLRAHYGLQALLYTVALHRYLRWRLAGYDPDEHLAGVLYLFVRGMSGPDTPVVDGAPCGVFAWRPPGALVQALSDVLDQGVAA